jgi:YidC/Oxa1 family membrane protein insertase
MFDTFIVQPIFNLLVFIYALLPGHNFGLAIILFTIVVRLLMWPLVKKQLHQVKLMRKVQPEIKEVKKASKGDRRKESMMLMELYKERGISPFGQIGVMLLQIPILLGLYSGLQKIVKDPGQIVDFAYPVLQHLSWMKELAADVPKFFDSTLFGIVDLTRGALSQDNGIYWPGMLIVVGSAVVQFYSSKQLMPNDKDARKLRVILRDSKTNGKSPDQAEVNAAISRSMKYVLPVLIFLFTVHLPSALSLYWLVGGLVAFIQQHYVLREDVEEMEAVGDKAEKLEKTAATRAQKAVEGEIIPSATKSSKAKKNNKGRKKRRS